MLDKLLEVVAEKTGYAIEELELDFELEADLGIDTVKQAEVLSELREHYGFETDENFRLADVPTLEALAGYLQGKVGGEPPTTPTPPPVAPPEAPSSKAAPDKAAKKAPPAEPAPPAPRAEDVVTSPSAPTAAGELPSSFRIRRPVLVDRPCTPDEQTLLDFRVLVLGDGPTAHAVRQEIALRSGTTEGPYNTVIDLSSDVMDAFRQARFLERDRPSRWLTLTRLGGFDTSHGERAWSDGARAGFTKALHREWDECTAQVIDLAPGDSDLDVANALCDELRNEVAGEVFIERGRRRIVRYRTESRPSRTLSPVKRTILITGGARGICARIAVEFATRGPCTLVLVGRSEIPDTPWDLDAEKARIKAALLKNGERATPAAIDKELSSLRRANEVLANLAALRSHPGVSAEYRAVDLADPTASSALGRWALDTYGTVDICIHGAGVEESRLIAQKDEAAWHRVFDGKALGGRALIEVLPESTLFISMGSVAGRFGNPGQVDYAAANDAMARACLAHANALHIDWTAWDDVGMAAGSAMKRILEERGVDLLPADAGAALLVDLVDSTLRGEFVVAGRLGDFQSDANHPLLDRIEYDGDCIRGYRELSAISDPWILDHAIDDVPVLPGVIGLELMAAVATFAQPGSSYVGIRDVRFEAPVKVHGDQSVLLVVEAEPVGPHEVRTRLIAARTLRTGRILRQEHFSAVVQLGLAEQLDALPNAFMPDEPVSRTAIYERFFHGPIFQVLQEVFGVSVDGLVAEASTEPESIAPHLLTAPLVLEAAFQAAGLHQMLTQHTMGLPMGIAEARFIQPPEPGERFSVTVYHHDGVYDIDVDGANAPLMRVRGYAMAEKGPLAPDDRFPLPEEARPSAFPRESSKGSSSTEVARAQAEEDPTPWLTPAELTAIRARGTERRIRDRLAGRIAAKRALSRLTSCAPLQIGVHSGPSGEPVAVVPGHPGVSVSVSHREGHAVAVAVRTGRIGVDLEAVQARPPHFAQMWLSPEERDLCAGDPLLETLVWSAKEAVLKALGTGMAIAPRHVHVVQIGEQSLSVRLDGDAHDRWCVLGQGALTASWTRDGDHEIRVQVALAA